MREGQIEIEILSWLNKQPDCMAFKINQSGYHDGTAWRKRTNGSLLGVADILGIWKQRPLAIEVKSESGRVSAHQERFIENYKKHGGIAFVARSLEDVIRQLP
jgi:hypothetical protein